MPYPETYGKTFATQLRHSISNGSIDQVKYHKAVVGNTATTLFMDNKSGQELQVPNGVRVSCKTQAVIIFGDGTEKYITGFHSFKGGVSNATVSGAFALDGSGAALLTADTSLAFSATGAEGIRLTFTGTTGTNRVRVICRIVAVDNVDDMVG